MVTTIKELRCIHRHSIESHPACFAQGKVKYEFRDDAEFERILGVPWYQHPDYRIGYLDIEKKLSWLDGNWPYDRTNIPLYPLSHWERNNYPGNHTVKLQRFSQKPVMSFWLGARADYLAYMIAPFRNIVEYGKRTEQKTKYSQNKLPVIAISNDYCIYCDDEDDFTNYFIDEYQGLNR